MNIQNIKEYNYRNMIYHFLIKTKCGLAFSKMATWRNYKHFPVEPRKFIACYIAANFYKHDGVVSIDVLALSYGITASGALIQFTEEAALYGTLGINSVISPRMTTRFVYTHDDLFPKDGEIKPKEPEPDEN